MQNFLSTKPLVSVIVPCFNEVNFIEDFVTNLCNQSYKNVEIIIADGNSSDGTLDVLNEIKSDIPNLKLVENKERIVSTGLNSAIHCSSGSIIIRFDVHTEYDTDYISEVVNLMLNTDYDCVGGSWNIFVPRDKIPRAIALSFKSYFGSGGAKSRSSEYSGPVDTVYLGAWRREAFQKFGNFDENLVRNQDDEYCHRIKLGGGTIYQSPKIKSTYHGRRKISKLCRQFYQYGFWKPYVIFKHKALASFRHLCPSVLSVFFMLLILLSFYKIIFLTIFSLTFFFYFGALLLSISLQFKKEKFIVVLITSFCVALMHFSYGFGFLHGVFSRLFRKSMLPKYLKISR